jgi:hypothetical protein
VEPQHIEGCLAHLHPRAKISPCRRNDMVTAFVKGLADKTTSGDMGRHDRADDETTRQVILISLRSEALLYGRSLAF